MSCFTNFNQEANQTIEEEAAERVNITNRRIKKIPKIGRKLFSPGIAQKGIRRMRSEVFLLLLVTVYLTTAASFVASKPVGVVRGSFNRYCRHDFHAKID